MNRGYYQKERKEQKKEKDTRKIPLINFPTIMYFIGEGSRNFLLEESKLAHTP